MTHSVATTQTPRSSLSQSLTSTLIDLAERGWLPDSLIRAGIRKLCRQRLQDSLRTESKEALLNQAGAANPIAIAVDSANQQHYEVPTGLYQVALGKHLKYSACLWGEFTDNLDQAEQDMLQLYAERADIHDGQRILDLGCGWGSFSLWAARHFPDSHITAVSNSRTQKDFIDAEAKRRGLNNLKVITEDVNQLHLDESFDRIISVEMLEHVRNHNALFARIKNWLKPDGLLFVHIFCHKDLYYTFETEGSANWMGRYFFTGGVMPAQHTLVRQQDHLALKQMWQLNGKHYARTAEAWLENLDLRRESVGNLFSQQYGTVEANRWINRWRIFFMACAELFAYNNGREWLVAHYLFQHPQQPTP